MDLENKYYINASLPEVATIQTGIKFTFNCTEIQNFDNVMSYPLPPPQKKNYA